MRKGEKRSLVGYVGVVVLLLWGGMCAAEDAHQFTTVSTNRNTQQGYNFEMGQGVQRDLRKAWEYYEKGVDEGDAEAQYRLGYAHQISDEVTRDVLAAHLFLRAAQQGHAAGTYWLGVMHQRGRGLPKNQARALPYFRIAAEKGHPKAAAMLGWSHRWGKGTPIDYAEALRWYRPAAAMGEVTALASLGQMYYRGQGVKKNDAESLYWRYRAYRAGWMTAAEWLDGYFELRKYTLAEFERRRILDQGKVSLVIRVGDSDKRVLDLLGKPRAKMLARITDAWGKHVSGTMWQYDVGDICVSTNVVVFSTVLLTTDEFARGLRPKPPEDWRVHATLSSDTPRYWALATSALLAEHNAKRHNLLGTAIRTEENAREQAWSIFRWWGIANRGDLIEQLDSLRAEGHRAEFNMITGAFSDRTKTNVQIVEELRKAGMADNRIMVAQAEGPMLGPKSILGWDYCRYVALCRWGYLVGYLAEDEAWARIMPAAELLQATFDSWGDLGKNYLIGRQFWSASHSGKSGAGFRKAYRKLLDDPESPWRACRWDLDLSQPDRMIVAGTGLKSGGVASPTERSAAHQSDAEPLRGPYREEEATTYGDERTLVRIHAFSIATAVVLVGLAIRSAWRKLRGKRRT